MQRRGRHQVADPQLGEDPDTVWDAVKPHFSEQEISDLTPLIVAINGWNRIAVSFRKMPG
ncbi:hypothetical protein F6X39_32340 [Paraburkholderia sp. UCT2]|nr:hypothetical protein [Paraburkholderia sp. UCT2]